MVRVGADMSKKGFRHVRYDDIPTDTFTPRTYQVELLESALQGNTIACLGSESSKVFLGLMVIKQLAHQVRATLSQGGKRSIYLVNSEEEVEMVWSTLFHHTDLAIGPPMLSVTSCPTPLLTPGEEKDTPHGTLEKEPDHPQEKPATEEELTTTQKEPVTSQRELLTSERDLVTSERELVTSEQDAGTSQREAITSDPIKIASSGNSQRGLSQKWAAIFAAHNVLVLSAPVFLSCLERGDIPLSSVNLLVLDDCHLSEGDHPYVSIMSHVARASPSAPHLLCLTAAILGTEVSDPAQLASRIQHLEVTLHSKAETSMLVISERFGCRPKESIIQCEGDDDVTGVGEQLASILHDAWNFLEDCQLPPQDFPPEPDPLHVPKFAISECINILQTLGSWCAASIAENLICQLEKIVKHESNFTMKLFLRYTVTQLRLVVRQFEISFTPDYVVDELLQYTTPKVRQFVDILRKYKPEMDFMIITREGEDDENMSDLSDEDVNDDDDDCFDLSSSDEEDSKGKSKHIHIAVKKKGEGEGPFEEDRKLSGLVFVDNRYVAFALNKMMEEVCSWDENLCFVKSSHITGQGIHRADGKKDLSNASRKQEEVLRKFRMQERNLLISTSVLEEGVDIPKCNLVVRFDPPRDYRSYTLSKGRARARDAEYIILVDEELMEDFSEEIDIFKGIEQVLIGAGRGRQDLEDAQQVEQLGQLEFTPLPTFCPLNQPGAASVSMKTAISLVNRYCAKLPSDAFTHLTPHCRVFPSSTDPAQFVAHLRLPVNSPIKVELQGVEMPSRQLAKMAVALQMCQLLFNAGELDCHLQPVGKEMFVCEEEEEWEEDEEEGVGQARPGTTKRKQYYIKKPADVFVGSGPKAGADNYLYYITMTLTGPITEDQNTRGRKIYAPEDSTQSFGLLLASQIPHVPSFPVYTRSGEVTVSLELLKKGEYCEDQLEQLIGFHHFVFSSVLHLEKDPMVFCPELASVGQLMVPLDVNTDGQMDIDWSFVQEVNQKTVVQKRNVSDSSHEAFRFDRQQFEDAVVMPSYRNMDQPQHFYVAEIREDLSPLSPFPSPELYKTFAAYYSTKYGLTLTNMDQPLLDVDHTSARLNLLTPRYMNQKGRALPTSSLETKRARRENLQQKQILVPELCDIHIFSASLWRKAVCLPAILYRVSYLLLAEELRKLIAGQTGIGKVELDPDFRFPRLNFGFETNPEKVQMANGQSTNGGKDGQSKTDGDDVGTVSQTETEKNGDDRTESETEKNDRVRSEMAKEERRGVVVTVEEDKTDTGASSDSDSGVVLNESDGVGQLPTACLFDEASLKENSDLHLSSNTTNTVTHVTNTSHARTGHTDSQLSHQTVEEGGGVHTACEQRTCSHHSVVREMSEDLVSSTSEDGCNGVMLSQGSDTELPQRDVTSSEQCDGVVLLNSLQTPLTSSDQCDLFVTPSDSRASSPAPSDSDQSVYEDAVDFFPSCTAVTSVYTCTTVTSTCITVTSALTPNHVFTCNASSMVTSTLTPHQCSSIMSTLQSVSSLSPHACTAPVDKIHSSSASVSHQCDVDGNTVHSLSPSVSHMFDVDDNKTHSSLPNVSHACDLDDNKTHSSLRSISQKCDIDATKAHASLPDGSRKCDVDASVSHSTSPNETNLCPHKNTSFEAPVNDIDIVCHVSHLSLVNTSSSLSVSSQSSGLVSRNMSPSVETVPVNDSVTVCSPHTQSDNRQLGDVITPCPTHPHTESDNQQVPVMFPTCSADTQLQAGTLSDQPCCAHVQDLHHFHGDDASHSALGPYTHTPIHTELAQECHNISDSSKMKDCDDHLDVTDKKQVEDCDNFLDVSDSKVTVEDCDDCQDDGDNNIRIEDCDDHLDVSDNKVSIEDCDDYLDVSDNKVSIEDCDDYLDVSDNKVSIEDCDDHLDVSDNKVSIEDCDDYLDVSDNKVSIEDCDDYLDVGDNKVSIEDCDDYLDVSDNKVRIEDCDDYLDVSGRGRREKWGDIHTVILPSFTAPHDRDKVRITFDSMKQSGHTELDSDWSKTSTASQSGVEWGCGEQLTTFEVCGTLPDPVSYPDTGATASGDVAAPAGDMHTSHTSAPSVGTSLTSKDTHMPHSTTGTCESSQDTQSSSIPPAVSVCTQASKCTASQAVCEVSYPCGSIGVGDEKCGAGEGGTTANTMSTQQSGSCSEEEEKEGGTDSTQESGKDSDGGEGVTQDCGWGSEEARDPSEWSSLVLDSQAECYSDQDCWSQESFLQAAEINESPNTTPTHSTDVRDGVCRAVSSQGHTTIGGEHPQMDDGAQAMTDGETPVMDTSDDTSTVSNKLTAREELVNEGNTNGHHPLTSAAQGEGQDQRVGESPNSLTGDAQSQPFDIGTWNCGGGVARVGEGVREGGVEEDGKRFPLLLSLDEDQDLARFMGPSPCLLLQALTMSNANDFFSLERLETIGDSFLKYAITVYLYCCYPGTHEGKLSYLRSKQVSNYNLYRLGRRKGLAERMVSTKFEPYENWLPPGYIISEERRRGPVPKVVIATSNPKLSASASINFLLEEEDTNTEGQRNETEAFQQELAEIDHQQAEDQQSELSVNSHKQAMIPYSLQLHHGIPDKSVADCVEALIGCYLTTCGKQAALTFMSWLGLKVLPRRRSGRGPDDTEVKVGVFQELQCPPSPLLSSVPEAPQLLQRLLEGFEVFEARIDYQFRDRSYLLQAFTHASYHYNYITDCYQRLEFLGDAILDYVITRHLYEDSHRYSPGILTDLRSALVNNNIFAALAVKWDFHKFFKAISPSLFIVIHKFVLRQKERNDEIDEIEEVKKKPTKLETDEEDEGEADGREVPAAVQGGEEIGEKDEEVEMEIPKALGDIFESVAGAIYLDSGMSLDTVWRVYYRMMKPHIDKYLKDIPKSPVRELLEMEPETAKFEKPERTLEGKIRVTVNVVGKGVFYGVGRNYRIAKSAAAKKALRFIRNMHMEGQM